VKFGLGQPLRRYEDQRLLTGKGRYTDDIALPAMAFAAVLRSPVAHGRITKLDATAARRLPGVLLVLTGDDVTREKLGDIPCAMSVSRSRLSSPRPSIKLATPPKRSRRSTTIYPR